jgi:hydrazine synthase alpha subunit-like protein
MPAKMTFCRQWIFAIAFLLPVGLFAAAAVSYDIVYVRQPRFGDNTNTIWPEVFHPARLDRGADLMLLHPDGTEELLVAGGNGGVTDPFMSFDGKWCYYALFPDLRASQLNSQRENLPYAGSDIYRIHLSTRAMQRLTFQEFTPNTGAGNWHPTNPVNPPSQYNRLGYGILNLGPCPVPGAKIAFTSNRNGYTPPRNYTAPTLQLFVMDDDGENVTPIAPMSIGSALHPTPLQDGRVMFSSYETQGLRDVRLWGIWAIQPDGRNWGPIISAFRSGQAFHFMTQLRNGDTVLVDYYNLNNNGFGALYRIPPPPPYPQPAFYSAFPSNNPAIAQTVGAGYRYDFKMAFTPRGMYSITPFTTGNDEAAPVGSNSVRVGKFTHPSAAPSNDLLVVWTPGPANDLNRPTPLPYYDAGLYLMRGANIITNPSQLILIKNDPAYNEAWPRAVVPWRAVHGTDEPTRLPWLPNDGSAHPDLPPGTPHGIVGTSGFYKRESFPGYVVSWANKFDGLDAFNTAENEQSSNWNWQGADAGKYSNADIWAVRIVALEPNSHRSYGPNSGGIFNDGTQFFNHAHERHRIIGEIPLRKFDTSGAPVLDPEGNPDTSFMAKIPADTPFTFQMLDRDGLVLAMAQTWHQVRPGEVRNNCGGCHAHSQRPLDIATTFSGRPEYKPWDLTRFATLLTKNASNETVLKTNTVAGAFNVEFLRDIRPLLQRSCTSCHTTNNAPLPGNLALDDYANYSGVPGDYARLAEDSAARWGYKPVISSRTWRQSNSSRYVRPFQSRRSLLIWKIFGRRLDGWTNAEHPTESVPGDPATLPAGADPNAADLDYTGDIMPPPGSGVPPLSEDEKMTFARWVDLGCPINTGTGSGTNYGWHLDDLRPTLTVSSPQQNRNNPLLTELRIGIADAYSGISNGTLSVKADFPVNGLAANSELVGPGTFISPGIFRIPLNPPISNLPPSHLTATVLDGQSNRTTVKVRFWVAPLDFRILSLVAPVSRPAQLEVRFENPDARTDHTMLHAENLGAPLSAWSPLTLLGWEAESNRVRRVEVQAPSGLSSGFLRVRQP